MKGSSMGKSITWVFAIIISIVMLFLVNSLTWLFPIEMIRILQFLIGALMIMSILIVY